jgi:hypothetical protein
MAFKLAGALHMHNWLRHATLLRLPDYSVLLWLLLLLLWLLLLCL